MNYILIFESKIMFDTTLKLRLKRTSPLNI